MLDGEDQKRATKGEMIREVGKSEREVNWIHKSYRESKKKKNKERKRKEVSERRRIN